MNEINKKSDANTKAPIMESSMSTSKDGKWFIHKTTITTIKPVNYIKAVLASEKAKADLRQIAEHGSTRGDVQ